MRMFRSYCPLVLIFVVNCALLAFANSSPATGENAYCSKGDIPHFGDKDGPAALPRSCFYTGIDGTPSTGKQIRVREEADFESALDSAKCGDTILLPAGSSYRVRSLPAKNCDDSHYVTVRTDTPDAKLPPEGSRISPAWAGIANLPGRPVYAQPQGGPAKLMATFIIKWPLGASIGDHYRFLGIEWTSDPAAHVARLVSTEGANHVIFDRNWFHPAEGAEMTKGIMLIHGTRFVAVVNSYLNGFNCVARLGTCTDASAIAGGTGSEGQDISTLKIYNDFLEAAGECILFGGGVSDVNPVDIEIRRNHLFRPLTWKEDEPGYTPSPLGAPYIVKNNFELKSAIRVLFEGNLLENTWGGFSQTGFAILLTPRNQSGRCPKCAVTDVTIRYNRIRNVAGVLQIANPVDKNGTVFSADGGRYSIHDLFADSIHERDWKGEGAFATIISNMPLLHDVTINHVTAFVRGPLFQIKGNVGEKIPSLVVTNNVLMTLGNRNVVGAGRATNCPLPMVQRAGPKSVLDECFVNYTFEKNLIITGDRGGWPPGNLLVSSAEAAGIRDFKDGVAADATLCRSHESGCKKASPGRGASSDGKDLGADIEAIQTLTTGVE